MNEMLQKIRTALAAPLTPEVMQALLQEAETVMAAEVAVREEMGAAAVRRLANTLSYTEADALRALVQDVPDEGGLLVASKVADREGFTRSVRVNALRTAESAGFFRVKSLGMKGTHVSPLRKDWRSQLTTGLAEISRPRALWA